MITSSAGPNPTIIAGYSLSYLRAGFALHWAIMDPPSRYLPRIFAGDHGAGELVDWPQWGQKLHGPATRRQNQFQDHHGHRPAVAGSPGSASALQRQIRPSSGEIPSFVCKPHSPCATAMSNPRALPPKKPAPHHGAGELVAWPQWGQKLHGPVSGWSQCGQGHTDGRRPIGANGTNTATMLSIPRISSSIIPNPTANAIGISQLLYWLQVRPQ